MGACEKHLKKAAGITAVLTSFLMVFVFMVTPVSAKEEAGYTGLIQRDGAWYYVVNGVVQEEYTGVCFDENAGAWYVKDGKVDFSFTGLSLLDGKYWGVMGGKVCTDYTGLFYDEAFGWWYLKDGCVDHTYYGLVQYCGGWWCVYGGKLQNEYTGLFYDATLGWWYIKNGMVDFSYSGLVNQYDAWWCINSGKLDFDYVGLWYDSNVGWWYVKNGMVDYTRNGLEFFCGGWWCVAGGNIPLQYSGLWYDENLGWWYIKDGMVDFEKEGFIQAGEDRWVVSKGAVLTDYTGMWGRKEDEYLFVKNGRVDLAYQGLAKDYVPDDEKDTENGNDKKDKYVFVTNGEIDKEFEGMWHDTIYNLGLIYISDGAWDDEYSGLVENEGSYLYFDGGKFRNDITDSVYYKDKDMYVYVKNGVLTDWNNYIYEDILAAKNDNPDYSYESEKVNVFIKQYTNFGTTFWIAKVFCSDPEKMGTAMANGGMGKGRQTTSSFASSVGAVFAVNASGFNWSDSLPQSTVPIVVNGEVLRAGQVANLGAYSRHGSFFMPRSWIQTDQLMNEYDTKDTFVFGPTLIENGDYHQDVIDGYQSEKPYGRSVVGTVKAGYHIFLVTDRSKTAPGLNLYQCREIMKGMGCQYAYNLDGGGSATMTFQGKLINAPADGTERAVVQFIYLMP